MDSNNLSLSMKYVALRGKAEAGNMRKFEFGVEYMFLGLLKLAEIRSEDGFREKIQEVDDDIAEVKAMFVKHGVDTGKARPELRHVLKHGGSSDPDKLEAYLDDSLEIARKNKRTEAHAQDLLTAIIKKPTDTILQVCNFKSAENENVKPNEAADAPVDEMSLAFLPELTNRVRKLRAELLNVVQGQDHVVHAFAEGIFAAEVLAASDIDRKRPKAIFVFAGPPGVGKTFLSEQAAQAINMPFKRFDMSSFADRDSQTELIGWEKSYRGAKEGALTGFVAENPSCMLLFDEIEKAHLDVIQIFLQILDAGRLSDRYTGDTVSFKDTIIIFTTNACKSLYEGDSRQNAAGVPRQTILNALETEKDPRTGVPFFPAAITSRLGTGWPLLFNHLKAHDLEKVAGRELERFCALFEKQYGIRVSFDEMVPTALMFREGAADARTVRAQTELFFKNEIYKLCRLWDQDHIPSALKKLNGITFMAETESTEAEIRSLFYPQEKAEVLIYGDEDFAEHCRENLPDFTFYGTQNVDEALALAGEKDIQLVLLDVTEKSVSPELWLATIMGELNNADPFSTNVGFNYSPMAAKSLKDGNRLLRMLTERLPEIPVYLLETPSFDLDEELTMNFVRAGARGKITMPDEDFTVFEETLEDICGKLYLQHSAARIAGEHKILFFETAPALSKDQTQVVIRLRDFMLKRAAEADDSGAVLDDVEKPNIHFSDVIGASDAKQELKFFVEYLKNPKKFCAQGIKPPKGVLLYGPPGTGKTMLAKALAGETDVAFLPAAASSFVNIYIGSGPRAVRDLFKRARRYAPSIIFIDEIDTIGRKRTSGVGTHAEETTLNALLTEMDGFAVDPRKPVFVMAATNFDVEEGKGGMGVIDPALARRFDRQILVDLPNEEEREQLLRALLKKHPGNSVSEEMIQRTAQRSTGMSPAALTGVIDQANRMAVKDGKAMDDAILDEAYELVRHGAKKDWGYDYLERVARHESGHAFMCFLNGNTPAYLTIVARGDHGGYMEHSAKEMAPLSTKEELLGRIRVSLGGRAAEIVYYGKQAGISTGPSGDLEQAARLATAMLCAYGMDENFGMAPMDMNDALRDPGVRERVNEMLRKEMNAAIDIIKSNKHRIDRLVKELMKKNKLTGSEIEELLQE